MNNMLKNMAIWLVIGIVLMTVFNQFNSRQAVLGSMDYSQFLDEVKQGRITKVTIQGRTLEATTTDGKKITTYAPPDLWMVSDLLKNNVKVIAKPEEAVPLTLNGLSLKVLPDKPPNVMLCGNFPTAKLCVTLAAAW